MNKVVNAVVGNWTISGIYSLHGGFPLTISGRRRFGNKVPRRPRQLRRARNVFGTQNSPSGGYQWFDPNSYSDPSPHTFGVRRGNSTRTRFKFARSRAS